MEANQEKLPWEFEAAIWAFKVGAFLLGKVVGLVIAVNVVDPLYTVLHGWGWL